MTRTTKNINVRPNWCGFEIYNNYEKVDFADNYFVARNKAIALAKKENKGVRILDDWNRAENISAKKIQTY